MATGPRTISIRLEGAEEFIRAAKVIEYELLAREVERYGEELVPEHFHARLAELEGELWPDS